MDFVGCCKTCVSNAEFVKQFNRIIGNHLGEIRNPIEIAIDQACGMTRINRPCKHFAHLCLSMYGFR